MLYIVYKKDSDRKRCKECLTKINDVIYNGDSKASKSFSSRTIFLPYSSINNETLLRNMDESYDYLYTNNGNYYLKTYDKCMQKNEFFYNILIALYTHAVACTKEDFESISRTGVDYTYSTFYGRMGANYACKIYGGTGSSILSNELLELGLLTFDYRSDNDLKKGYLYDREYLYNKIEKRLGEGSFEELNHCIDLSTGYNRVVNEAKFNKALNYLRKYFYISIREDNDLSLEEKNSRIISFDEKCSELRDKYLPKKKKTL